MENTVPNRADTVSVLLAEYSVHGNEVAKRSEIHDRVYLFLQGYTVIIIGGALALFTQADQESLKTLTSTLFGSILTLALLIAAQAINFQLIASMCATTYIYMVLRRRMAEIESQINETLKAQNLMRYERVIAPNFFERLQFPGGTTTPTFVAAITAYAIVLVLSVTLVVIALGLLPRLFFLFFLVSVLYWLTYSTLKTLALVGPDGQSEIDQAYSRSSAEDTKASVMPFVRALSGWIFWLLIAYAAETGIPSFPKQLLSEPLPVFLYSLATSTIAPLPSEAPVLFIKSISDLHILTYAALGKFVGTLVLIYCGRSAVMALFRIETDRLFARFSRLSARREVWLFYFVCQAIPFLPMRSSSIFLGTLTRGAITAAAIATLAAIGTIIRMMLMLSLIQLGLSTADLSISLN